MQNPQNLSGLANGRAYNAGSFRFYISKVHRSMESLKRVPIQNWSAIPILTDFNRSLNFKFPLNHRLFFHMTIGLWDIGSSHGTTNFLFPFPFPLIYEPDNGGHPLRTTSPK